jgi:peptide/nickel transport system permease protein
LTGTSETGALEAKPARARWRLRLPWLFAALLLLLALFGPLLANDVPLVARVGGHWSFPALAELFGAAPPGPGDLSWRQWAERLPAGGGDFCWWTIWAHGPLETDLQRAAALPSLPHPLGQDDSGRDVLARMIRGTRPAVGYGACGVLLAAAIGVLLGGLAGHRRGLFDIGVLRLVELFLCFPMVLALLAFAAVFGDSAIGVVVVFALAMWPSFARIVRGELLALREREFVAAARGLGIPEWRIVLRHMLPQVRGQIAVTAAFCMAQAVVAESTLSFLGIGPGAQAGSWGGLLAQGKQNAQLGAWHLWCFPGAAIVATVMCCHALADRMRPRE